MSRVVISGVREASSVVSIPNIDLGAAEFVTATVSRSLPADLTAVRQARDVVRGALTSWYADDIMDDVTLVASELVANALRHGIQVERQSDSMAEVKISLISTGCHLICAVTDPSQTPPVRRSPDVFAGSGRGLQLVESLSLLWGWNPLQDDDPATHPAQGKSVWAIFPLSHPESAAGAA